MEVTSTQDIAMDRLKLGKNTVVLAERQNKGRGQYDRRFSSDTGGLYMSVGLSFDKGKLNFAEDLTVTLGHCVKMAIENLCNITCTIKLPNDILIEGKKVCGILTEARDGDKFIVVFGIGVNVKNDLPAELMGIATSLKNHCETPPTIERLAEEILANMAKVFDLGEMEHVIDEGDLGYFSECSGLTTLDWYREMRFRE